MTAPASTAETGTALAYEERAQLRMATSGAGTGGAYAPMLVLIGTGRIAVLAVLKPF